MKNYEVITEVNGIKFYQGNIIGQERIVFTDYENYRINADEDIIKACNRIYRLWYA